MVSELGEKVTFLLSGQDMSESRSIFSRWCDARATPLVVRDTAMPSLAMVGASRGTVLINRDLPTDSKTTFTLRFTFIRSGVRSIFISAMYWVRMQDMKMARMYQ